MAVDPEHDPFRPPAVPTLVFCMRCHREYESYLIQWVQSGSVAGETAGCWRCPTPGCPGAGFGFDIFPLDSGCAEGGSDALWFDADHDYEDDYDDEDVDSWLRSENGPGSVDALGEDDDDIP